MSSKNRNRQPLNSTNKQARDKKKRKKKSIWQKIYHFMLISSISLIVLLSIAIAIVYNNRDKVVKLILDETNKQINTPVEVADIDLSLFDKFPQIAVHFHQVNVKESLPGNENPLATLQNVYCTFGFWQLFTSNYTIDHFYLEDGSINLKRLKDGSINYQFFKENTTAIESKNNSKVSFKFENVDLKNVTLYYLDEESDFFLNAYFEQFNSQLKIENQIYHVASKGDLLVKSMLINEEEYANKRKMYWQSDLDYFNQKKELFVRKGEVELLGAKYHFNGDVKINDNWLDFYVKTDKTNIESLVSLLPENTAKDYQIYRSKGEMELECTINGSYANSQVPLVDIKFSSTDATFYHPEYNKSVDDVSLTGSFTNGQAQSAATSQLILKQVRGKFEGKPFTSNLKIQNFDRYLVDLQLKADLEVNSFLKFYPVKEIYNASGRIVADIDFYGYLKDIKTAKDLRNSRSAGEINLQQLNFDLADFNLPFRQLDGNFLFKNDALAISNFSGKVGQSDFLLNGMFKNVMAYLFLKYQPILIEADLESRFVNLDELLSGQQMTTAAASGQSTYQFNISKRLNVDFDCKIGRLILKRFEGRNISGDLTLRNQRATSKNLKLATMGGHLTMSGYLDARKPVIETYTTTRLNDIYLDSAFYVFKNFNQNFLQQHHLKGQLFAEVRTYLEMDHQLKMNSQSLISNIEMTIKNGELNNFEPMLELSKYVDKDRLNNLRFADLRNEILVHNRQVFLPKMEVGTNITKLEVNGTHTFDQHIDYHVKIPVKRYRVQESKFGTIQEDDQGNLNMFLKIQGTTDNYNIAYDTRAWKQNFDQNLKNEGQELKQIFKNKGKKEKKSKELNEEEVFEWN